VFCRALLAALERSEKVCRQHGIRFEAAGLKADLERELSPAEAHNTYTEPPRRHNSFP